MQVIVDENAYAGPMSSGQTVQELVDGICGPPTAENRRLIIALACNGEPVVTDRLAEVMQTPVERFEIVEMQTVAVREQIHFTVTQALDILKQAHQFREDAAGLLSQGRHEAAMTELQKMLEILKQVQQTTVLSAQLLGVDLDKLNSAGCSLIETLALIKAQLGRLKDGMESQDFVTVSDLLRYEFGEPLEAWTAILSALDEIAVGQP